MKVLAINPGSTSTKIAVFSEDGQVFEKTIRHAAEELSGFKAVVEQYGFRSMVIMDSLAEGGIDLKELNAVIGRGGFVKPISSGTYRINDKMLQDLSNKSLWGREHASNLGAFLAKSIGDSLGIQSFIVDPVVVDEILDIARISGVPEIKRKSVFHALNVKACARKAAAELGKGLDNCNFVIIHMGGGVSVVAFRQGRCIDVNNALLGMGPFSPQRAGSLPIGDLVELAFSGKYSQSELLSLLSKKSGLIAYTGTDSGLELEKMILEGNDEVKKAVEAMAYQIVKEAGGMAAAMEGQVDGVIITGGLARMEVVLMPFIRQHLAYLGRFFVYPGEKEMDAMAEAAFRILQGKEEAKEYNPA